MPEIEPISDSYIEEIIKVSPLNIPDSGKTRGAELRELVKHLRDYFEQELNKAKRPLSTLYFRIHDPGAPANTEDLDTRFQLQAPELVNATSVLAFRGTQLEVILAGNGELYSNDQVLFDPATGVLTFKNEFCQDEAVAVSYRPALIEPSETGNNGFPYTLPITF